MELGSWDVDKIKRMIANYEGKGATEGGIFPLSKLHLELRRRIKSDISPVELAHSIVARAAAASDGLVTYKELWTEFRPGKEWVGNKSQQIMGNALSRVVGYCVRNGLPILTALVVKTGSRTLDPAAVANICNEARTLGVTIGPEPDRFIDRQRELARSVVLAALPSDDFDA